MIYDAAHAFGVVEVDVKASLNMETSQRHRFMPQRFSIQPKEGQFSHPLKPKKWSLPLFVTLDLMRQRHRSTKDQWKIGELGAALGPLVNLPIVAESIRLRRERSERYQEYSRGTCHLSTI